MNPIVTAAAVVTAIGTIGGGAIVIDQTYVDESEMAEQLSPFVREYRQQRIWDMEENVEKSDTREEGERWMKRLRKLIGDYCVNYPKAVECSPEYLHSLQQILKEKPQ